MGRLVGVTPGRSAAAFGLVLLLVGVPSPPHLGGPGGSGSAVPSLGEMVQALGLGSAGTLPYVAPFHPRAPTTFYVAPTGSDTAPCTSSQPCRQPSEALGLVSAGETIDVANGVYLGFDVSSVVGSPSSPVTLEAPGRHAVLTNTVNRSDNRDIVHILTSSHIVLDGFEAFNANRAAVRIDQSDNITVTNGTFGNNTVWGIFTDFDKYSVLEHNTCYGSVQQHGIYVSNSPVAPTLRWNTVYNNYGAGIQINADASQGGWGISSGGDVEDNVIYDNGAGGGAALNFDGVWNTRVVNNLLYGNHATGIVNYYLDGLTGPHGMTILDNTVVMASNGRWALQLLSTTGENYVRNNILDNLNPAHGGEEFGTWGDVYNTSTDYEVQDTITVDSVGNIYTLAQWQGMGYEPHSLSASPASLFVNPGAGDYHLLSSAPAIRAGAALSNVTLDLAGVPRPTTSAQDIGCYQYGAAVLSATFTAAPTSGTVPLSVVFSSTVVGGGNPFVYVWRFGDGGAPSGAADPSHIYNLTGTFPVQLTVTNSTGVNANAFGNITVAAPPPLRATASGNPLSGPAPLNVTFSSAVSGGTSPYSYLWTFGDGSPRSHAKAPLHEYNSSGTFTASLEVNDSASHAAWSNTSISVTTSVPALSVTVSAYPTHGATPLRVVFASVTTGGVLPYNYTWSFGDGSDGYASGAPSHTYTSVGNFPATLTVTDAQGHTQSASVLISTHLPLSVRMGGMSMTCAGIATGLWAVASGGTGPVSFDWNFGDGSGWQSTGTTNHTTHLFPTMGTYDVVLIANDSGGDSNRSSPWAVSYPADCSGRTNPPATQGSFLTSPVFVAMLAAIAAAILGVVVMYRRRKRGAGELGGYNGASGVPVEEAVAPGPPEGPPPPPV
ncbi:MAG: PKD domain-containing protein [Euryarchaeota archaeon]|nr:PKD domain-containing protein [Euryarchaeota archaeon]MDE1836472.1 PKD domain-containing protein [Euryarchaeota archaeon]MDE1880639.1 PKD domain-containing protein [Euryarchaeota archaeon]MDE2044220.1 PKD domain-containing protein [Thermoplasmata archaeon]